MSNVEATEAVVPAPIVLELVPEAPVEDEVALQATPAAELGKEIDLAALSSQLEASAAFIKAKGDKMAAEDWHQQTKMGAGVAGIGVAYPSLIAALILSSNNSHDMARWTVQGGAGTMAVTVGAMGFAAWQKNRQKRQPVDIPNGMTLQSLRVDSGDAAGQVVVAVHPRQYRDAERPQSEEQARKQLADALEVVAGTSSVDTVMVPAVTMRRAGLLQPAKGSYQSVLDGMFTETKLESPYEQDDLAVVLPKARLADIVSELRSVTDPLLGRALSELAARFRLPPGSLKETDPNILRRLVGMVRTAANEELPAGRRQVSRTAGWVERPAKKPSKKSTAEAAATQPMPDDVEAKGAATKAPAKEGAKGDGVAAKKEKPDMVWDVVTTKSVDPLVTLIEIGSNPYDIIIRQRRAATYEQAEPTISLRHLAGGQITPLGEEADDRQLRLKDRGKEIADQLALGGYDKLQLLGVAIELLEVRSEAAAAKPAPQDETPYYGEAPVLITRGEQKRSISHMRRYVARMAIAATLATSAIVGATDVLADILDRIPPPPIAIEDNDLLKFEPNQSPRLFRVDMHGLHATGYWPDNTHYSYSEKYYWGSGSLEEDASDVPLPETLPDAGVPHLTVTAFASNQTATLPVRQGTRPAAMRVTDPEGKPMQFTLRYETDGVYWIQVDNSGRPYKVQYDLVESPFGNITAEQGLVVQGSAAVDTSDLPGAEEGADAQAHHTHENFTYDNSRGHKRTLSEKDDVAAFVEYVYETERCNCAQCAHVVAAAQAKLHPNDHIAYTVGPLVQSTHGGHTYLDYGRGGNLHAWLTVSDENGDRIVDATPYRQDGRVGQPDYYTQAEQDEKWARQGNMALATIRMPIGGGQPNIDPTGGGGGADPIEIPIWPLLTMVGTMAVASELRNRRVQYAFRYATRLGRWVVTQRELKPETAVKLMAWHAYGPKGGQPPDDETLARQTMPQIGNLSDRTLKEVARGSFRGSGGLNRAANRALAEQAKVFRGERKRPIFSVRKQTKKTQNNVRR